MNIKESQIKSHFLSIHEYNSFESIMLIQNDWNYLHKSFGNKNIYTDFTFYKNLFQSRASDNSKIKIVLFKENENPVALIVGWINTKFKITIWFGYKKLDSPSLKCYEIENNGIITDGRKETLNGINDYFKTLIVDKEIDLFTIYNLDSKNPIYHYLSNCKDLGKKFVDKKSVNWQTQLLDLNSGNRIKILSNETLRKLRLKTNKFNKDFENKLSIMELSSETDIESFIKNADFITKNSYQYSIMVGITDNKYWNNKLNALAKGQYLKAYMLFVDQEPAAYLVGAVYSNTLYLMSTAYNYRFKNYYPGEYLRYQLIEEFLRAGINTIDYGYGDAEYKQRWGNSKNEVSTIRVYGKSLKGIYSSKIDKFITKITLKFLLKLKNSGFYNKIKLIWRQKLIRRTAVF